MWFAVSGSDGIQGVSRTTGQRVRETQSGPSLPVLIRLYRRTYEVGEYRRRTEINEHNSKGFALLCRFGYDKPTAYLPFNGGVSHSNDYIYLFPYPKCVATLNAADTEMAKRMVRLWTSFATHGRPEWPLWAPVSSMIVDRAYRPLAVFI